MVNAGSSSLKLRLLDEDDAVIARHDLVADRGRVSEDALTTALGDMPQADAIGHRIVHGGARGRAVVLDDHVREELVALSELAPLHQPSALDAAGVVERAMPGVPAVACFDTSFHARLPAGAATYALPRAWRDRWPLRRYGFHGLSHAYAARRVRGLLPGRDDLRIVVCHLGAGASLCAVRDGHSVDTTMGFTPLEGLVMATRSGDVDPGLVLWLVEHAGLEAGAVAHALEHEAGLLGLAGSDDMREVLAAARDGDEAATLALDVYIHRLRAGIAGMAVALDGPDALVFTGGVGEHAPAVRARAAAGLGLLDVRIDSARNDLTSSDAEISAPNATVRTFVITAREDLEIAREVRAVLDDAARPEER